jgi:hypothetical protein
VVASSGPPPGSELPLTVRIKISRSLSARPRRSSRLRYGGGPRTASVERGGEARQLDVSGVDDHAVGIEENEVVGAATLVDGEVYGT